MKYTGEIKDLKSYGFTFHKLYANNYKVYEKDIFSQQVKVPMTEKMTVAIAGEVFSVGYVHAT